MKIIEISQASDEWKLWRQSRITATSASIIMGNNPWKSKIDLFNEMLGITPPQELNAAMARGSALEPEARELFIKETGIDMIPIVCENDDHYWMAASLDGWCEENNAILEIKSPNEKTHEMACEGIIPIYYSDQMQHQLAVTKGSICYYMSYRPEYPIKHAIIEVFPNIEYIEHMIELEKEFYFDNLCSFKEPEGPKPLKLRS